MRRVSIKTLITAIREDNSQTAFDQLFGRIYAKTNDEDISMSIIEKLMSMPAATSNAVYNSRLVYLADSMAKAEEVYISKHLSDSDGITIGGKRNNYILSDEMQAAIDSIPNKKCRDAMSLYYLDEMKIQEVADALGINYDTARQAIFKGTRYMRVPKRARQIIDLYK